MHLLLSTYSVFCFIFPLHWDIHNVNEHLMGHFPSATAFPLAQENFRYLIDYETNQLL